MNYYTNQLGRVELFRRALLVGLGAQLISLPALLAQDAPVEMKKQVITGSFIPTAETVTAAPVDIITPEAIARSGGRTIDEVLRKTPTAVGGGNFGLSRGNGGDGTAGVLNVSDEAPPLVMGAFGSDSYDRVTHDLRGRYWYVQASKKF